jgi:hypothetical protein
MFTPENLHEIAPGYTVLWNGTNSDEDLNMDLREVINCGFVLLSAGK